jgi:hypothetical protein
MGSFEKTVNSVSGSLESSVLSVSFYSASFLISSGFFSAPLSVDGFDTGLAMLTAGGPHGEKTRLQCYISMIDSGGTVAKESNQRLSVLR